MDFQPFPKIGRLSRNIIITEKLDGSNGQLAITEDGRLFVGSRSRWIAPEQDNHGFASWAYSNKDELLKLGPGRHFGEWWGCGIQRGYGIKERRFSLFNVRRWTETPPPSCCGVVPVLWEGDFDTGAILNALNALKENGSAAAPGYMNPEGVIVFHTQSGALFKKTYEKDDAGKGFEKEKTLADVA
jgi:hypothetical protein